MTGLARYKAELQMAYLAGNDERTKKDTFAGPLLEGDLEVGFCAVDVYESDQQRGDRYLGTSEDIGHKGGEGAVERVARGGAATLGGGWPAHSVVDRVYYGVNDILWRGY